MFGGGVITEKLRQFLTVKNPVTPTFVLFAENSQRSGLSSGRPIVTGIGSVFCPLAVMLDKILSPLIQVDGLLAFWRGDVGSLQWFHDRINGGHPSISFSLIFDLQKIYFVDVLIYRDQGGHIHTSLFTKPTDRNQMLYYHHPPHIKKLIPISQLSRVQRLVSETEEKFVQRQTMCKKFRDRGYPERTIQQAQHRVECPRIKNRQSNRIPFVTQFHADSDAEFKTMPLISSRKERAIGAQAKCSKTRTFWGCRSKGMFHCLGCTQCPFVLKSKEFIHPHTGYTVQLQGYFTCISKFAIYVLICLCGLIYIGETTHGHTADQLKFMVLETIPPLKRGVDRELKLKQREVWWIKKLGSYIPQVSTKIYDLFLFL
ncbi:hypothetical protein XELAEV_18047470mg [Xenopus laevis]|uniref:Helix-turn-helix domain-containing protein n=1 Tax=Xenopus laevis TaxID=8355 RepID=A0A974BVC9_XENLA|nr:hypothetical protein XELAEV_18047470mg [Xenopus laevis]